LRVQAPPSVSASFGIEIPKWGTGDRQAYSEVCRVEVRMARFRRVAGLFILCGTAGWGSAQEPGKIPTWQQVTDIGLRAGYKDNVTLASSSPEASAFLGFGLDAMVWRGLGPRSRLEAVVFGEHRQFLDSEQIEREQIFFGLLQLRQDWSEAWESGLGVEYIYQDQVIDVTATEAETLPARIRGQTLSVRSQSTRELGGGSIELELAGTRQLYEETLDDYWAFAPSVEWTWPVLEETELSLGYRYAHDWYDRDPALSESGEPIPGTRREAGRHELRFTGRRYWGEDRRWRLTFTMSGRVNRDHASGYYDYVRPQASLGLRYRPAGWEIEGGVRANYYDYAVQRVAAGDSELRRRSGFYADVMVQRRVSRRLRLFIEYNYEQTFSNREVEEYSVNTLSGGLGVEF
jgi:hypothetical protein